MNEEKWFDCKIASHYKDNLLSCLLLLAGLSVSAQQKETLKDKSIQVQVILISIDGLRPEMYLDAAWPNTHLKQLMQQGTFAEGMNSVFPSFTYPSHVAMLTGALPARSGIYYNAPRGSQGDWNWFLKDIKAPTLWQALKNKGMTSAAVQWPVSVGEGITWNVPEIWDNAHPEDRITTVRKYATPGLVEELERYATGVLDSSNMNEEFGGLDVNAGRMATYIYKTYHPNLLAVHFAGVDGMQHGYGRDAWQVKAALENVDHAVGGIVEAVARGGNAAHTTILVVGDHGFSDIHSYLQPNALLKGLDVIFQPAGGSAFLYVKRNLKQGDKQGLKNRKQMDKAVQQVNQRLDALPDAERKLFRIVDRKELDRVGADSSALLALTALPGWVFGGSAEGNFSGKLKQIGGHHGYDPNLREMKTGFLAWGAGVKSGGVFRSIGVADVAPLIARLLGLDFICPDGHLPVEVLKQ